MPELDVAELRARRNPVRAARIAASFTPILPLFYRFIPYYLGTYYEKGMKRWRHLHFYPILLPLTYVD